MRRSQLIIRNNNYRDVDNSGENGGENGGARSGRFAWRAVGQLPGKRSSRTRVEVVGAAPLAWRVSWFPDAKTGLILTTPYPRPSSPGGPRVQPIDSTCPFSKWST